MDVATKCLSFNVLVRTKIKQNALSETSQAYFNMVKELRNYIRENAPTRKELHESTYSSFRERGIPAQLIISARVYAWNNRKNKAPKKATVRFDKRLHSFKKTKRGNPILSIRCLDERIGIPIAQDGAFDRLQEHLDDGWRVTSIIMTARFNFHAILSKEFEEPKPMPNTLGVDVNSGRIAISITNPSGRVLRQLYFGRDIYLRQHRYEERRAKIMHRRDKEHRSIAKKAFNKLSGKQRTFVRTRIWQTISEIIALAREYNASVAIEDLKHLRKRRGEWSKRSRKKVNRIPYGFFRRCVEHKALIEGIPVIPVEPKYTSQRCSRCGHTSRRNRKTQSLFKCVRCGFTVNADRNASINICHRAGNATSIPTQISMTGAAVNQPVRPNEVCSQHP